MTDILRIEGWAAIYDVPDLDGDVIAPGAFARSLRAGEASVRMLWQHDPATPVGRWLSFSERPAGLWAVGEIVAAGPRSREAAGLVEAGVLDGLSIGYRTIRSGRFRGARIVLEAALWEVSLVTFPMAPKARIARVGGGAAPVSTPGLARALRDAAHSLSV